MIFTKAALQLVGLTTIDKGIPLYNCLRLETDGSIAATNGKVWAWVSPLIQEKRKLVPLPQGVLREPVTISNTNIMQIIKMIPKDTLYKGLLEHVDIALDSNKTVLVITNDGKQQYTTETRQIFVKYPDYRQIFQAVVKSLENTHPSRVCLNRKRLYNLTGVIEKICPYDGIFAPIWWFFAHDGSVLLRCVNELNGQSVLALLSAQEGGEDNLNNDEALFLGL